MFVWVKQFWSRHWRASVITASVAVGAVVAFSMGVAVGTGRLQVGFFASSHSANSALPTQLDYRTVTEVYRALKQNYNGKLTTAQLLDGLKSGLANATGDPYTEYFNAAEAKAFTAELDNSFSGIGAELGKDDAGNLIIISPIKGFPADKAGLKPQDIITEINGVSTSGLSPDTAVNKIRGPAGTKVTLKVVRNKSQTLTFTITRDNIQLPSVTWKTLDGGLGYMQISSFADDTGSLAEQAATAFRQAHVKGVVLDLRGNPGGLLSAAVDVSSLWLPAGTTIVTERGTVGTQVETATGNALLQGMPTVVLIDDGSASASEITAGALHDNGAARLIGIKSFGKGVVQQLINFDDGSELKVTVASWYRPNGQNINKKGITPDQTVTLSDADAKAGNDTQLTAAEAYLAK
ncbi:MAG TPA: S41 family peptidase [Candidatus Saccharimonadales bacterium]|nr:S41 family peptidase [Candidatus Saccharimonadales bacterium]